MRYRFLLLNILLSITCITAQKENPVTIPMGISYPYFPSFKEVVAAFYTQFKGGAEPEFTFEKRPAGYYIIRLKSNGETLFEPELFWSATSKTYQLLTIFDRPEPYHPGDEESLVAEYNPYDKDDNIETYLLMHRYEADQFALQPFYGYKGWYRDVIQLLEPKTDLLNNNQLNALARAYSAYADAMLMNHSRMAIPEDIIDLSQVSAGMTKTQLEKFVLIQHKGVSAFKKLAERSPEMMTPIGTIYTKYSNEVMDGFMRLLYVQGEAAAVKLLVPGLYDDFLLHSARNLLTSCPKDAFLIVNGDTDYFATLYVQVQEGFRRDIIVANSSLLQLPVYYNAMRRGILDAKPLMTNIPESYFQKMHILTNESPDSETEPVPASAFFSSLAGNKGTAMPEDYQLVSTPIPALVLPPAARALTLNNQVVNDSKWAMNKSYMFFDQLVLLDIIVANQWQRPVCFAMTCSSSVYSHWRNHLALEGLVYTVYPDELSPASEIKVNTTTGLQRWQQFSFVTDARLTENDKIPFYRNSLMAGIQLAKALMEEHKKAEAANMIHLLEKQFPNEQQARGYFWYKLPEILAAAGEPEKAEQLALQIVQNYKSGRLSKEELKSRDIVYITLSNMAETYGLANLKTAIFGK